MLISPPWPLARPDRVETMIILIGMFTVDPADRVTFITNRIPLMEHSRAEAGCVTYAFTADPVDPAVVILAERWVDRASLDAHLAGLRSAPQPAATPTHLAREIFVYTADEGTLL